MAVLSPSPLSPPLFSPSHWDPHQSFNLLTAANVELPTIPAPTSKLFLGLDLSTQALKGAFIDESLKVVYEQAVRFDEDLPSYGTSKGVVTFDGGVVVSPTLMFVEAIDLLFGKLANSELGRDCLRQTVAVSAAAQQHGTVYWGAKAQKVLSSMSAANNLKQHFAAAFSTPWSPNWQDSSTHDECRRMEEAVGGPHRMAELTGSRAHERFSGPQILRFREKQPGSYAQTSRISLISSFLTTVLCGDDIKDIDESDACGMNLYNIAKGDWDTDLLQCVAGNGDTDASKLRRKLGPVQTNAAAVAGRVNEYFTGKYGLNGNAVVGHATGDNNSTAMSHSLSAGDVLLSFGTSDTILASSDIYHPHPDYHVFTHPANIPGEPRRYMGMLCFKNGSLSREYVRDRYARGDWNNFDSLVRSHTLRPASKVRQRCTGFYYLRHEIVPHNAFGIHRFDADDMSIDEFEDPSFNNMAILEAQFLSYRNRLEAMLGSAKRIYAVGGGSANETMMDVLASVLDAPVHRPSAFSANSCAIGACMKAYWVYCTQSKDHAGYDAIIAAASNGQRAEGDHPVAVPDAAAADFYRDSTRHFSQLEARALQMAALQRLE